MKTENVDVSGNEAYRLECERATEMFVRPYPAEFFAWLADASFDLIRDEMVKAGLDPQILRLYDGAIMIAIAARMVMGGTLDVHAGMATAETLPEMLTFVIGKSTGFEPY